MFGRKSNQIKALKQTLCIKERELVNRFEVLKSNQIEIMNLKTQNATLSLAVEELRKKLTEANSPKQEANPPKEILEPGLDSGREL